MIVCKYIILYPLIANITHYTRVTNTHERPHVRTRAWMGMTSTSILLIRSAKMRKLQKVQSDFEPTRLSEASRKSKL